MINRCKLIMPQFVRGEVAPVMPNAVTLASARTVAGTAADYVATQLGACRARLKDLNQRREGIDKEIEQLVRVIGGLEAADERIHGDQISLDALELIGGKGDV